MAWIHHIENMLDISTASLRIDDPIPIGWHFPLIACNTARKDLRMDGFPGLGIAMPSLGLPRTLAMGRKVQFNRPLSIGMELNRTSRITSIQHKEAASRPMATVQTAHEIRSGDVAADPLPSVQEEQTYALLQSRHRDDTAVVVPTTHSARPSRVITADETLLFQFSALTFNSHRIHLDRDYARDVEGYPDLVVNGGLITLMMTEIVRVDLRLTIHALTLRNRLPLFCNRPIHFFTEAVPDGVRITAHDPEGRLAAAMDVATHAS
jgi:3-methylfumaryl-CoA hydratase